MSQQLAINVINYASTLVTSERDADVEYVHGAFSALRGLSQTRWGKQEVGLSSKKSERETGTMMIYYKPSKKLLFRQ